MARREYTHTQSCAEPGCKEVLLFVESTQKDYMRRLEGYRGWKCLKHDGTSNVLTPQSSFAHTRTLTAKIPADWRHTPKWFWYEEGKTTGTGFVYGDKWRAYCEDFPVGTILKIHTAIEIILPDKEDDTP